MTWLAEWVTVSTQARLYDVAPQCTGAFTLRGARTDRNPTAVCRLLLHCCSPLPLQARG